MIRRLRSRLACLLVAVLGTTLGSAALAASYYWDTNGTSAGIGSSTSPANWLTNNWATGSSGIMSTGAWPNTQPSNVDEAVFQGTAGTVNLGADVYANALRFQTNNYTIASTSGVLHLTGDDPTIMTNLASNGQVVTISAPISGSNGLTVAGNSTSTVLKFVVLANADLLVPNSFVGPLEIEVGGALRLGGGQAAEQIPDDADMLVVGVIDFITSGGASDGKQEKVRDVAVTGAIANFSVGNESDFVVNSITGTDTSGSGIALNGNNGSSTGSHDPGTLRITGWHDGKGDLTLHDGIVRLNTTGGTSAVGSRVILSGDIESSGESSVTNVNGGGGNIEGNTFTNRAFDFAGAAHTVNVSDGVLTFTSRSIGSPLEITTTQPSGAVVTKTGAGTWRLEDAVQTDFTGATKVQEGVLSLDRPALADAADLYLASGTTLDLDFDGTDEIHSLYFDDVSQLVGTWGSMDSMADHKSTLLSGNGLLQVTSYAPLLVGDFNNDKVVDAADYTVWRDHLGDSYLLPNDRSPGLVSPADYDDWKANFASSNSGSGAVGELHAVPEPDDLFAATAAFNLMAGFRRRNYNRSRA